MNVNPFLENFSEKVEIHSIMCYNRVESHCKKGWYFALTTGQIIKMLREERGMTQEYLAELMGYSHKSSINKIEMGKADLPQSKLMEFAKIFNVSPCVLLGYEPASDEQKQLWDAKFNAHEQLKNEVILIEYIQKQYGKAAVKMLRLFTSLNENGKQKAIENLEDLTAIEKYLERKGE
jgi:transcriptional regulator with XRE-family HTH domain